MCLSGPREDWQTTSACCTNAAAQEIPLKGIPEISYSMSWLMLILQFYDYIKKIHVCISHATSLGTPPISKTDSESWGGYQTKHTHMSWSLGQTRTSCPLRIMAEAPHSCTCLRCGRVASNQTGILNFLWRVKCPKLCVFFFFLGHHNVRIYLVWVDGRETNTHPTQFQQLFDSMWSVLHQLTSSSNGDSVWVLNLNLPGRNAWTWFRRRYCIFTAFHHNRKYLFPDSPNEMGDRTE